MSESPRSSLATPVPPSRVPPSPQTSNNGHSRLDDCLSNTPSSPATNSFITRNVQASDSPPSSPSSSSTSASVSFTLAPVLPSSLSIAPFASLTSSSPTSSAAATAGSRTTSCNDNVPLSNKSVFSSSPFHSPTSSDYRSAEYSPNSMAATHRTNISDVRDGSMDATFSEAEDARASSMLQSLGLSSPKRDNSLVSGLEPGEVPEVSLAHSSQQQKNHSSLASSPEVVPSAPAQTYIPLPEIEIHPASFHADPSHSWQQEGSGLNISSINLKGLGECDPQPDSPIPIEGPKTPNVYINGLPPHFPEDQLFELCTPFGQIRSVRSFTRHVGERESGYGFVLYETVDAAEKCIQSLRRFRNLHPTFSKQVHKIPGTPYAHISKSEAPGSANESVSFKQKMEHLHDPNSTNIYIEGLPMTIDEASLSALVSPNRIKSSRFFQTRLSNPPRIIAFVRLETRAGAEEVIDRLHGRMVRGWNDPGSRISVRFADTTEQRELRRAERAVRHDGDQSPSRLTIAQAALLNLHGREQLKPSSSLASVSGLPIISTIPSNGRLSTTSSGYELIGSNSFQDFASNAHSNPISLPSLRTDINFAGTTPLHNLGRTSPYNSYTPLPPVNLPPPARTQQELNSVTVLLESLRNSGVPLNSASEQLLGGRLGMLQSSDLLSQQHQLANMRNSLGDMSLYGGNGIQAGVVAQARNGYTPAEEYLLQNHVTDNQQRRRPNRLDLAQAQAHAQAQALAQVQAQVQAQLQARRNMESDGGDYNVGVRGVRSQAATLSLAQPDGAYTAEAQSVGDNEHRSTVSNGARPIRDAQGYQSPFVNQSTHQASHTSLNRNNSQPQQQQNAQAHVRSSTLPPSSSAVGSVRNNNRHYQHNSMSIPKSRNITQDIMRNTSNHFPGPQQHRSTNSTSSLVNDSGNKNVYINTDFSNTENRDILRHHGITHDLKKANENDTRHCSTFTTAYPELDYEATQSSPPFVSPALTYSSRGSAPSLSPATPFIGSFSPQNTESLQSRATVMAGGQGIDTSRERQT